jgi:hypothetical protein
LFYASHEANLKIKHYVMQRPVDFFSNLLTIRASCCAIFTHTRSRCAPENPQASHHPDVFHSQFLNLLHGN